MPAAAATASPMSMKPCEEYSTDSGVRLRGGMERTASSMSSLLWQVWYSCTCPCTVLVWVSSAYMLTLPLGYPR